MSVPTLIQSSKIADEIRARFPRLVSNNGHRLEDAAMIASSPDAVNGCRLEGYKVRSQSNAAGAYLVNPAAHTCTCPDHGAHAAAGVVCKHRLAVYILELFEEAQDKASMPAAQPITMGKEYTCLRTYGPRDRTLPDRWTCEVISTATSEAGELAYITVSAPLDVFYSPDNCGRTRVRSFRLDEFFHNKFFKILAAS